MCFLPKGNEVVVLALCTAAWIQVLRRYLKSRVFYLASTDGVLCS